MILALKKATHGQSSHLGAITLAAGGGGRGKPNADYCKPNAEIADDGGVESEKNLSKSFLKCQRCV